MKVKKAEYFKEYKIKMTFNDGVVKIVDFKPFLKDAKGLLIPLLDLEYFKSFVVDDTTICWPNEVDFCPDVLYEAGKEIREQKAPIKPNTIRRKQSPSKATVKYRSTYAMTKRSQKKT